MSRRLGVQPSDARRAPRRLQPGGDTIYSISKTWRQKGGRGDVWSLGWMAGWLLVVCFEASWRDGPKTGQDGSKTTPRRPKTSQDDLRGPQDGPRRPQDGPKTAPGRPKTPEDAPSRPKTAQDGSKTAQDGPKTAQERPKTASPTSAPAQGVPR